MSEVFSKPNDEARIHDFEQFSLWSDIPEHPGKRAILRFGERNGAPRLSVMANIDTSPKNVYVAMDPGTWYAFLNSFESVAKGQNGTKLRIDNLGRDKPSDENQSPMRTVRNSLWYGKDESGVCWLSIDQTNFPRIRFKILSTAWHYFYKSDGTKLTPEECSVSQTLGMIEALKRAYTLYIGRIKPPYQKQNSGKQPKNTPSPEQLKRMQEILEDDIPF